MALLYKNSLLKSSFRGIAFGITDVETTIGRRNVVHEYPLRDSPYAEDLGRKAREYTINAFVMNPNDYSASAALVAAIEGDSTPGILVHPTLGSKLVVPVSCKHLYKNTEGGIEYFTLTFVEAGSNIVPTQVVDTQGASRSAQYALQSSATNFFSSNFNVSGYADFIATNASHRVNQYSSFVTKYLNYSAAAVSSTSDSYTTLKKALTDLINQSGSLVFTPETLAADIIQINSLITAVFVNDPAKALAIIKQLFNFGDDFLTIPPTTNLRIIEQINQTQLVYLIKNSCLSEMMIILASQTYNNSNDALSDRDGVDVLVQEQLLILADNFDDDIYTALLDASVGMNEDLTNRALALPAIRYITTKDCLPALVLAYMQYEDASRDTDIITRNNIVNPVFIPADSTVAIEP